VAPVFSFDFRVIRVGEGVLESGEKFFLLGFDETLVDLGYTGKGVAIEVFAYGVRSLVICMKVFLSCS
jgi:hypothetical protein